MPAPSEAWIRALHHHLLDRRPAPHELARWTDQARRGASHRELADRFLRSHDYCRHQVEALYRCLLDGDGDPAAVRAWTGALRSGAPLQDVITGLCDSFEYRARHPPPEPLVDSLYRRLLHRDPDAAGKAGWLRALGDRASTLSVIQGFVRSTEFCTRRLTELHRRLLDREPGRRRLLRGVVAAAQGTALQHFVLEIATSAEYILRADGRAPAPSAAPDGDMISRAGGGEVPAGSQHLMRLLIQRHATAVYRPCRADPAADPAADRHAHGRPEAGVPPMCAG